MKPLQGVKVLDLSHRLPGPLGGKLLADKGAEVVKLEDEKLKDPFLEGFFATFDESFMDWYKELNSQKKVVRLDFKGAEIKAEMAKWIEWADIILMGLSDKMALQMGLSADEMAKVKGAKVVLSMGASQTQKTAMHDLNALADTGLLDMHVAGQTETPLAPPFLPVAGIAFGQQIALSAVSLLLQAQKQNKTIVTKVFMQEEIENVFAPFWSKHLRSQKRTKFLHNGAYPCYCLYQSKNGDWVAVAAVEEKFWLQFAEALNLKIELTDRFSRSPEVFSQVADAIRAKTTAELDNLLVSKDICVSLIRHRA